MTLRALYDLPAPAKLNLFLHVVGRRADGYHLLQSFFVLIDWADTLHFELRGDGRLVRHDLGASLPGDDLCLRAARALQAASGCADGVDISIDKRIPSGAGMGGGSSDAATTLLALNRLWRLGWPRPRLAEIGLTLGADVPFFVIGRNAFVEGIGERISPWSWPQTRYAVVKPPCSIATRDIFEHPELRRDSVAVIVEGYSGEAGQGGRPADGMEGGTEDGVERGVQGADRATTEFVQLSAAIDGGRNDLQAPAEDRCSEVAQAARWLQKRHGNSRMTGSGSAVFAIVGTVDPAVATPCAADFADLPQGWVGRLCRSLSAHPLVGWAG